MAAVGGQADGNSGAMAGLVAEAGLVGGGRLRASQGQQKGRQEGEAAGVGGDEVAHVAVLGWKRVGNL